MRAWLTLIFSLIGAAEGVGGFPDAQNNLGLMYLKGQGVPRNYAEAAKWFRRAGSGISGVASAHHNLGLMYLKGQGVPRDYVTAYMWFALAAARGDEDSRKMLDGLETKMTPDQIAKGQKLAREWQAKLPYYIEP